MMKKRQKIKKIIYELIYFALLILLALFFLFPFFVLLTRSLMTTRETLSITVKFFPEKLNFDSYVQALDASFLKYFKNTLIVLTANVIGVPLTAVMSAFAFAKINFKFKNLIFAIAMGTIMLPSIVTTIPLYLIYIDLGFFGTLLPLIIPAFLGGGILNIFLIRQFFKTLPKDIDEAARIDGANIVQWMLIITLPLIMPVVTLIAVNSFLAVWNDFMSPLVYLGNNESLYTLPVGLYYKFFSAVTAAESMPNVQMATSVIMIIPPSILFFIFQKQLVEGITLTGIKG